MTGCVALVFVLVLSGLCLTVAGNSRCFECYDTPSPFYCGTVTLCGPNEQCYVEELVTSGGLILYNSGCKSLSYCSIQRRQAGSQHRNRRDDVITCTDCCTGDYCNNQGCGKTALVQGQRGPYCYSCATQSDPNSCRTVQVCGKDQVCLIEKDDTTYQNTVYSTKCSEKTDCDNKQHPVQLLPIGKRQTASGYCPWCCDNDFCNNGCHANSSHAQGQTLTTASGSPSTATSSTVTHTSTTTTRVPAHTSASTSATSRQTYMNSSAQTTTATVTPLPASTVTSTSRQTSTAAMATSHTLPSSTVRSQSTPQTAVTPVPVSTVTSTARQTSTVAMVTSHTSPTSTVDSLSTSPKAVTPVPVSTVTSTSRQTSTVAMVTSHTSPTSTVASLSTSPSAGCLAVGYVTETWAGNSVCLRLYTSPKTWAHATAECHNAHAQLLTVVDTSQQTLLYLWLTSRSAFTRETGVWVNSTSTGQPTSSHVIRRGNHHSGHSGLQTTTTTTCPSMVKGGHLQLRDCYHELPFVCVRF